MTFLQKWSNCSIKLRSRTRNVVLKFQPRGQNSWWQIKIHYVVNEVNKWWIQLMLRLSHLRQETNIFTEWDTMGQTFQRKEKQYISALIIKTIIQYGSEIEAIKSRENLLTPWLMDPGDLMLHPHELSNNPCPERYQLNSW